MTALVLAGAVEGAALGFAQTTVLRLLVPGLRTRVWILATAAAAAFAWLLGMLPSTTHALWSSWPLWLTVVSATGLGSALLLSIGLAQARVLPGGSRTYRWVAWTALGWTGGLGAFGLIASPLWHTGQQPWLTVAIGLFAGTVMAVSMATITGLGVTRLWGTGSANRRG